MPRWNLLWLLLAIVAGLLGFFLLVGIAATILQILFFLLLAAVVVAWARGRWTAS